MKDVTCNLGHHCECQIPKGHPPRQPLPSKNNKNRLKQQGMCIEQLESTSNFVLFMHWHISCCQRVGPQYKQQLYVSNSNPNQVLTNSDLANHSNKLERRIKASDKQQLPELLQRQHHHQIGCTCLYQSNRHTLRDNLHL